MRTEQINIRDPYVLTTDKGYWLYGTRGPDCWGKADGFDTYFSRDLNEWEGPTVCFRNDGSFWADRNYWAPEVHCHQGAYYMFASFKNPERRRGTAILRADRPEGPFVPWSDGPVTPAEWECLDGTFYVSGNGEPYMVFCHEWVQAGDGEVCAVRLTDDLRAADGEPFVLFHASDAPWGKMMHHSSGVNGLVTDGPFLWRTRDGVLLCLWAGFSEDGYTEGVARSDNGEITGRFVQLEPLFRRDGGHGMIFRDLNGQLFLTVHTPNEHLKEHPVFCPVEEKNGTLVPVRKLPDASVRFETENAALQELFDRAERKAAGNLKDFGKDRVLTEGGGYEKIWLETQPMGGEMYAARDMEAALNNQLMFMRTQREDGRIAGSIQYMPDGHVEPQFNKFQGFCFPEPALNMYYWIGEDREYLSLLEKTLRSFDEYLWKVRDSDGDGVLESWCVYDTGEDNAVRYGDAPVYSTEDVPPAGYRTVPMASMDIMSFSYSARNTIAMIRTIQNDPEGSREWREKANCTARVMREHLWDERSGACFDRDSRGHVIPVLCHNNLRCMYWGSFTQEMANRFVNEHLTNPEEFMTRLPLPSVSVSDPMFRNAPENNWSGQCEGLTFQRALPALERYGYEKLAVRIGRIFLDTVIRGGYLFTQQYDPFTGEPSRVGMISHAPLTENSGEPCQDGYGPTALAVLEYIAALWGIDMWMGEIRFSLCRADAPYRYEMIWGRHDYEIISDGKRATIRINGEIRYEFPCGIRVITDPDGRLLRTRALE